MQRTILLLLASNVFGHWRLGHCEPIWMKSGTLRAKCWGWPLQILGAIGAVATVWKAAEILFFGHANNARFHRFPSDKFFNIWTLKRQSMSPCKLAAQNFKNFTIGLAFPKNTQKLLTKFPGLAILGRHKTPQWLQIAGNSRPNGPSMGCLVSIFTIRINSNFILWNIRSVQERYLPKILTTSDVRYCVLKPIVLCSAGAAWGAIYWRKAYWIWN